jgi:hypothetical protein
MANNPYSSRRDRAVMRDNRYRGGDALFLKRRGAPGHSDLMGSFCFKNAFARFRYFVRSLSSATTASIVTPETPFLKSSRFQALPSQRQSSLALSRVCSSLGADIGSVLVGWSSQTHPLQLRFRSNGPRRRAVEEVMRPRLSRERRPAAATRGQFSEYPIFD